MFTQLQKTYNEFPSRFWVIVLARFIDGLGNTLLFPFFALYITQKFNVGMTEAGVMLGASSLAGLFGGMFGGALADKFGRKSIILFGLVFSDPSANSKDQMAAFSSRGPTDDTRIKPDVVAPGTWILSTYSDMYQQGYDGSANPKNGAWQYDGYGFPYDQYYKYLSGTSMSNPLTAGGAAVVRDYYNKSHSINASAALVKATIINSAVDILDENNDGSNDNDYPIPNSSEGWGCVNLDGATYGTIQFVDEGTGLSTDGSAVFTVTSTGGPLKVTLVWTDFPSTDAAAINLVNDLDMTVSGPSGTFRGNVFSGG